SYDVYLGASSSPALAATVTGTSAQASGLSDGVTYYWRVVAKNATTSASSPTYSFTVGSTNSGNGGTSTVETLLSPSNGATGVPTSSPMAGHAVTGADCHVA